MNSERNWSEVRREVAFGERSLHGESKKEEGRSKLPFNRLVDDFNDACDRVCPLLREQPTSSIRCSHWDLER